MESMARHAKKSTNQPAATIIVVGNSRAGKTTFIHECIKDKVQENFLDTHRGVSHKSITTDTIKFKGNTGPDQKIIFREEPSLLHNPKNSCNILKDFVKFLHESKNDSIAGVVFVLNHSAVSTDQGKSSFKLHLKLTKSWMGNKCPESTILSKNRRLSQPWINVDPTWREMLGSESIIRDGDPNEVVQIFIPPSRAVPILKRQMSCRKLSKTDVGKFYEDQLDKWIKEAKKNNKRDPSDVRKQELEHLEGLKREFEKLCSRFQGS